MFLIYTKEVRKQSVFFGRRHRSSNTHLITEPNFSQDFDFQKIIILTSMHNQLINGVRPEQFAKTISRFFQKTPKIRDTIRAIVLITVGFTDKQHNPIPVRLAKELEKQGFNKGLLIHTISHPLLSIHDAPLGLRVGIDASGLYAYYHDTVKARLTADREHYTRQHRSLGNDGNANFQLLKKQLEETIANIESKLALLNKAESRNIGLLTSWEELEQPHFTFTKNGPQAVITEKVAFCLARLKKERANNDLTASEQKLIGDFYQALMGDLSRNAESIIEIIDDFMAKNKKLAVFIELKESLNQKINNKIAQFTNELEAYCVKRQTEGPHHYLIKFFAKRSSTYFSFETKIAAAKQLLRIVTLQEECAALPDDIRQPMLSGRLGECITGYGLTLDFILQDAQNRHQKNYEAKMLEQQKTEYLQSAVKLKKKVLTMFSPVTRSRVSSKESLCSWTSHSSLGDEGDGSTILQQVFDRLADEQIIEGEPDEMIYRKSVSI